MKYIDPHIHMISRTTDDYQRMAYAQCAAISEPAFWAGFDRGTAEGTGPGARAREASRGAASDGCAETVC